MSIDPLAEDYAYQSPYNFSENRVIDAREFEGLEAVDIHDDLARTFESMGDNVKSAASAIGAWFSSVFSDSNFEGTPEKSNKNVSVSLRSNNGGGNNPTTTGSADEHWNIDGFLQVGDFAGAPGGNGAKNGMTDALLTGKFDNILNNAELFKEGMDAVNKFSEFGSVLGSIENPEQVFEMKAFTYSVELNPFRVDTSSTIVKFSGKRAIQQVDSLAKKNDELRENAKSWLNSRN